jgi:fatty acid elongase 3
MFFWGQRYSPLAPCFSFALALLLFAFSLSPHPHVAMSPLADFLINYLPIPHIPYHYTHYVRGATPLSTQPVVLSVLAAYLATIFGIREIMKTRQPQKLTFLFQVHNAVLSSGSALLLALMLEEIVPIYWRHGTFYAMCNVEAWTEVGVFLSHHSDTRVDCQQRLELYYIINYYIKYVELVDTVFLALKKKPLGPCDKFL